MGSSLRRSHRAWLLKVAGVLASCLAAGLVTAGVVSGTSAIASLTTESDASPVSEPYLVQFAAGTPAETREAVLDAAGAEEVSAVEPLRIHGVLLPGGDALAAALAALESSPAVTTVEENREREVGAAPSDPGYGSQWSLPKIGWDEAFGTVAPSGTAHVAILDTGVDGSHPDLDGNLVPGTSILDSSDGLTDPNGHGTAMAGIVAAETDNGTGIAGVGYAGVDVMPVTVLAADGTGQDGDIIDGVVYAAQHDADVILMAFSNPGYSELLQEAIDYAWAQGVVLVAATGNDGSSSPTFPAGDRDVVGVSNTDANDSLSNTSNYGQTAFMSAPGSEVLTTSAGGGTGMVSGTSAAAAHVAGAAALLKAASGAENGVIVSRLARNADRAGASQDQTGNGRLNLARALADTSTESLQPAGASPMGDGGPFVGPYVIAADRNWTGNVSTDWFTAGNWSPTSVPTISQSVEIPSGRPRYPMVASGSAATKHIDLKGGASLTVTGGTLTVSNAANTGDLVVEGTLVQSGGTLDATFSGKIIVTGSSASVSQTGGTMVTKLLEITSGRTFTQNGSGATVRIVEEYKNLGTFTSSAGTIEFNPTDGTGTWSATGTNIFFNATVASGKTQPFGTAFQMRGDWSNFGTANISSGVTTTYNGTGNQNIAGTPTTFRNLTFNKASGLVDLDTNTSVAGTLTFTSGNVVTDGNVLIVTSTGSVTRTAGHVVGNLQRNVATGNPGAILYQVGTASAYTPVTVDVDGSGGTAGGLIARTDGVAHDEIGTSGLDTAKDVERFWTLTPAGAALGARTYKLTVQFLPADVPGGANTSAFELRRYDGAWHTPAGGVYTRTATTTIYSSFGAFSDFVVGEVAPANVAPATPANPGQFRADASTPIANEGFTNETSVVLKGDLSDPDSSDMVKLEVEVKPVGTAFDGSGVASGSFVTDPATASATVTGLAHGVGYHWRGRAVDDDGAASAWQSFGGNLESTADFTVDTAKPTLTASATSPPAGPAYVAGTWTNHNVLVAFDCQDALSGVSVDTVADVTVSTDGADQSVTSSDACVDGAGNAADAATFANIDLDKTAPGVTTTLDDGPDSNGWYNNPVDWTAHPSVDLSGIDECDTGTYSGPDGEDLTVTGFCTDLAGNSASDTSDAFKYDATAPGVTTTLDDGPDSNGWYNNPVDWTAHPSVDLSGIDECDTGTYSGPDGEDLTVTGFCTDLAGNSASDTSDAFKYDATAPGVTTTLDDGPDSNGWYNNPVDWTAHPSVDLSGIDECDTGTYSGPDGEDLTVTGFCTDLAGNSASDTSDAFKYDATAPGVTTTLDDGPDSNGWYNNPVDWTAHPSVDLSGIDECDTGTYSGPDGEDLTVTGFCTDLAGNSASDTSDAFKYDATAPGVTTTLDDGPDSNGWYNNPVDWTAHPSADLSGIDECDTGTYSGPDGEDLTVTGFCTDLAGNSASDTSPAFDYDNTDPHLSPTVTPNPVVLNGSATASPNATDNLSGVDSSSCDPVDTSNVGAQSVSCSATDNAGNTGTANAWYSVVFNFQGFFQPVDNGNVFNVVQAGRAIPVKFSLGGNQGLNIFASGHPASTVVSCSWAVTSDDLEVTMTSGSSGLQYDGSVNPPVGQYIYVWKTEKSWASTCRRLDVKLADGQTRSAFFSFKK